MKTQTDSEKQIIIDYTKNDLTVNDISKKYKISRQTIRKIVLRNGLSLKSVIDKNIKLKIINGYKNGKTNKELSTKFNLHRATIQRILKTNNIPLRPKEQSSRKKILHINFEQIDTNDKAYILGLIFADGNLSKNNIEISLKKDDKQILEDISKVIYDNIYLKKRSGKIWFNKKQNKKYKSSAQYRFLITCKKTSIDLRNHGLIENKSLKIVMPKLEIQFISHFIRGYFDGDGCLFVSKKYKGTNRVTIVSNYIFCEQLSSIINSILQINSTVQNKTVNVGCVSISGNNQVQTFLNWIYTDANLKLNRKYEKFITNYN